MLDAVPPHPVQILYREHRSGYQCLMQSLHAQLKSLQGKPKWISMLDAVPPYPAQNPYREHQGGDQCLMQSLHTQLKILTGNTEVEINA